MPKAKPFRDGINLVRRREGVPQSAITVSDCKTGVRVRLNSIVPGLIDYQYYYLEDLNNAADALNTLLEKNMLVLGDAFSDAFVEHIGKAEIPYDEISTFVFTETEGR